MIAVHPGLVVGIIAAFLVLIVLLALLVDGLLRQQEQIKVSHDACLGRIILEMGDHATASHLRHLADIYGKAEGYEIEKTAQARWTLEGPPMIVLLLEAYADSIAPTTEETP